jgi:hypothetical protein
MPSYEVSQTPRVIASRLLARAWGFAAAISFAWFLYDGVARVWSGVPTDFPNYYAAARSIVNRTPLSALYDYPEFQREIGRAGIDHQLGGYIPQTPLTMLPLIPLASLTPVNAKRDWLALNLGFLSLTLWLFSRITKFSIARLWLIVFAGYAALRQNFCLGQYYVFLLALLTIGAYCLLRSSERRAGAAFATALALKLYGAPFLLFLAATRRSRAVVAFMATLVVLIFAQLALFGRTGMVFYATQVLPRSLAGETLNPYHPSDNTFATLFRRLLIAEPALNPHPFFDSPAAFTFLQCAFTLSVLLIPVLAAWNGSGRVTKTDLAWWSIALLLVSPNTASYTFVLLALPVVLLLDEWPRRRWPYVLAPWFLLSLPLRPSWSNLFPRPWLLLFLFLAAGLHHFRSLNRRVVALSALCILTIASGGAVLAARFRETPAASAREIALQPEGIYSSSPIVTASGIFYESIASERYVVQRRDGTDVETFAVNGNAFHPSAPDSGSRVWFELFSGGRSSIAFFDFPSRRYGAVSTGHPNPTEPAISHDGSTLAFISNGTLYVSDGHSDHQVSTSAPAHDPFFVAGDRELVCVTAAHNRSQIVRIDLAAGRNTVLIDGVADLATPAISPDQRTLAFASRQTGAWQIWTKDLTSGRKVQVTDGRCNSTTPAWTLDSGEIVFASDCRRGLSLPALFRMPIDVADAY